MKKYIKIIASLFALTTPLFAAQAQTSNEEVGDAFWGIGISQHSLNYPSEHMSIGENYGDSATLISVFGGNRISEKLSWKIAVKTGDATGTTFDSREVEGFQCGDTLASRTEKDKGKTEVSETSAGILYGRRLEAGEKAPFLGAAYKSFSYAYKVETEYSTTSSCDAGTGPSYTFATIDMTGIELTAGYSFQTSDAFAWNLSYELTLIQSITDEYKEFVDTPIGFSANLVFFF